MKATGTDDVMSHHTGADARHHQCHHLAHEIAQDSAASCETSTAGVITLDASKLHENVAFSTDSAQIAERELSEGGGARTRNLRIDSPVL